MKMKAIFMAALLSLTILGAEAQIKTPQPSPAAKVSQTIGLSEVTVEYSRPGMKGRKIFGDLVKYGSMWRTGANKNTIVTFSHDVKIEGEKLAKGSYALFSKPSEDVWEVFFYTDTENWGTPDEWDESKVALQLTTKPTKLANPVESMMFYFDQVKNGNANLVMEWEMTKLSVNVDVPTTMLTMESIETTLAGPQAGDYHQAARFYRESGKDLAQAKEWIELCLEMGGDEKFWMVREHALILADMKDYKGAIEAAKKSLALAEAAEYQAYIDMNKKSIEAWAKM